MQKLKMPTASKVTAIELVFQVHGPGEAIGWGWGGEGGVKGGSALCSS